MSDPFADFDLEAAIAAHADRHGIALSHAGRTALVRHARKVAGDRRLHLSAIEDPTEFVARHVGESFEGAAMLEPNVTGRLVDLGSGNGYPGLPFALARPGLEASLIDASRRRTEFLQDVVRDVADVQAVCLQVQRARDLEPFAPVRVITLRAVGAWQKIVPRLAGSLGAAGELLLWAGADVEALARRASWARLECVERRLLTDRERSWIWRFRASRQ